MTESETILSSEEVEALLGRSLTTLETTNFSLYIRIAQIRLEGLLCTGIEPEQGESLPADLSLVLARMFDVLSVERSNPSGNITNKKVEDFSISYDVNKTALEAFISNNLLTISKYSKCQGKVKSGDVRHDCLRYV